MPLYRGGAGVEVCSGCISTDTVEKHNHTCFSPSVRPAVHRMHWCMSTKLVRDGKRVDPLEVIKLWC